MDDLGVPLLVETPTCQCNIMQLGFQEPLCQSDSSILIIGNPKKMTWRTKPWFQNQTIATRTPWLQVNMTGCSSKTSWAPTTIYTHIKHATYDTYTVYSTFWSCTFWGPGPWKEHCTNIGPNVPFEVPIYGNSGTVLFRVLDFQGYVYIYDVHIRY